MVGDPKHLSDLGRIKADVRIRCWTCGFEEDWTVADLSRHLHAIGGSTVWSEVTRHLTCRKLGCGSPNVRATPVPYARRQANLPRRVGTLDKRIIEAALAVLDEASRRRSTPRDTIEVRLALLILHRYARDRELIAACWRYASRGDGSVVDTMTKRVGLLRWRLVERGWIARPEILRDEVPHWPWQSPAPPGYLIGPGQRRDGDDDPGSGRDETV